jgi:3',5'-cyclic AMP phosphodiesterase CpdA
MLQIQKNLATSIDAQLAVRPNLLQGERMRLRIIHCSDMHFVARMPGFIRPWLRSHHLGDHDDTALRAIGTAAKPLHPDIMIVTGDLSTFGDVRSLERGRQRLIELAAHIGIGDATRVIMIPGNHDHCLRYLRLQRRCTLEENVPVTPHRRIEVRGIRIDIFSFDSSADFAPSFWPFGVSIGGVGSGQFDVFNARVNSLGEEDEQAFKDSLKIAVLHHHPLPVPHKDVEGLTVMRNGGTFIAHAQSNGINLVLHGHQHYPYSCSYRYRDDRDETIVVAAGTASQHGGGRKSFNIIDWYPWKKLTITTYVHFESGYEPEEGVKSFVFESGLLHHALRRGRKARVGEQKRNRHRVP